MADDNGTARREIPYLAVIREKDPDFFADRRDEPEYRFPGGRVFTADQSVRGPYNDDDNGEFIEIT